MVDGEYGGQGDGEEGVDGGSEDKDVQTGKRRGQVMASVSSMKTINYDSVDQTKDQREAKEQQ